MKEKESSSQLNQAQYWGFIILRIIIGWYFLYEGIVKLMNPAWSAENFLNGSQGFLSEAFHWMASQPAVLEVVNILNIWGLILIGLWLFLGFFARTAVYAGILLLFFYYVAYPPLGVLNFGVPQEGSYLLVNKNFILLVTLVVLVLFPRTLNIGLWSLLKRVKFRERLPFLKTRQKPDSFVATKDNPKSRRELLKHLAFLPFLGGFIWTFISTKEETRAKVETFTGATITLNQKPLSELEGNIPRGKLGNKQVSRLIFGNNLIGGWSHARDLIYTSQLFKAYNTESKIFESLQLAEKAGINTMNLISSQFSIVNRYKKLFGSNLQTMVQVGAGYKVTKKDICDDIDRSIDKGADFIQIWGVAADLLAYEGKIDELQKCIDYAKRQGYPVGVGAHDIHTFYACDQAGIDPDFYFKTMHHDNYRSALPKEDRVPFEVVGAKPDKNPYYNNMWCLFPEETVDYVQKVKKPVFGYKVLAAGAIPPEEAFQYAFDNGADFICVGMFDFQIVEDANITIRSIEKAKNRKRPWYG